MSTCWTTFWGRNHREKHWVRHVDAWVRTGMPMPTAASQVTCQNGFGDAGARTKKITISNIANLYFFSSGRTFWTPSSTSTMEGEAWSTARLNKTEHWSWNSWSTTTACIWRVSVVNNLWSSTLQNTWVYRSLSHLVNSREWRRAFRRGWYHDRLVNIKLMSRLKRYWIVPSWNSRRIWTFWKHVLTSSEVAFFAARWGSHTARTLHWHNLQHSHIPVAPKHSSTAVCWKRMPLSLPWWWGTKDWSQMVHWKRLWNGLNNLDFVSVPVVAS